LGFIFTKKREDLDDRMKVDVISRNEIKKMIESEIKKKLSLIYFNLDELRNKVYELDKIVEGIK
jgi:hypothetical protein